MLGVDEGARAAGLLHLGDHMQGQGGLAGALRPVDLDHPPLGQAADAEGQVQAQRAGGGGLDLDDLALLPKLHHRALAEGPVYLRERRLQRTLLIHVIASHEA